MVRTSPVTPHPLDECPCADVDGRQVTRGELSAAFSAVADPSNWKLPVDTTLDHDEATRLGRGVIREAVIFFAGCVPTFENTERGVRVRARGYYAAVGA
jgi:hypothetical protein